MPKVTLKMMLLGASIALSGCHSMHRITSDSVCTVRDHYEAKMAWWDRRGIYADCETYLHHFGKGFQAGYRHVAGGGDGCPPAIPPDKYYGACYQNEAGREKVIAWYNGWSHGVYAAECDGVRGRNRIPTARDLYGNCRSGSVMLDLSQFEQQGATADDSLPPAPLEHPSEPAEPLPLGIAPPAPEIGY